MAKRKVEYIDKNGKPVEKVIYIDDNEELVEEVVNDVDGYEPITWGTIEDAAMNMAKLKDEKFKELVKSYIKLAYESGQPVNLLEDLLNEI